MVSKTYSIYKVLDVKVRPFLKRHEVRGKKLVTNVKIQVCTIFVLPVLIVLIFKVLRWSFVEETFGNRWATYYQSVVAITSIATPVIFTLFVSLFEDFRGFVRFFFKKYWPVYILIPIFLIASLYTLLFSSLTWVMFVVTFSLLLSNLFAVINLVPFFWNDAVVNLYRESFNSVVVKDMAEEILGSKSGLQREKTFYEYIRTMIDFLEKCSKGGNFRPFHDGMSALIGPFVGLNGKKFSRDKKMNVDNTVFGYIAISYRSEEATFIINELINLLSNYLCRLGKTLVVTRERNLADPYTESLIFLAKTTYTIQQKFQLHKIDSTPCVVIFRNLILEEQSHEMFLKFMWEENLMCLIYIGALFGKGSGAFQSAIKQVEELDKEMKMAGLRSSHFLNKVKEILDDDEDKISNRYGGKFKDRAKEIKNSLVEMKKVIMGNLEFPRA